MKFSYNWFKDYVKKLPQPKKLADLLTMHSFEVEEVEKIGQDWVLNIDVLPNRAGDCFSHLGVAREMAVITGQKCAGVTSAIREVKDKKIKDFISVEVKNKTACLRYTARVVTDVKVGPSPKWIQERLKLCGLKPVNNIVDIANYVMLETGQPLHAFDFEKISDAQNKKLKIKNQKLIIAREGRKGERIITLDNEEYILDDNILIIADPKEPLAIAGIKGGKKAEIDEKTKIVVLESANFSPGVIRKSSRKLKLKTDASIRFEQGIDPNLTEIAINRAAYLVQEIANSKIVQGMVDFYPKKILPKMIKLDLDYVERLLGIKIPEKEIKNILTHLQFKVAKNTEVPPLQLVVEVPTRRLDISMPEDLIEEIGRIYGYQKIPAIFPIASLIPPKRNLEIFWEEIIKDTLKETGFTEVYNYSFFGEKEVKTFGCQKEELIEVENPTSQEQKYLRMSLIPNLLKNTEKNLRHIKEIKIFELGKIFQQSKTEKRMLTGVMTGDAFYQAKGVADLLFNKLGISNIWYDSYQSRPEESETRTWHPKKRAEIKINHQGVGFLGGISPKILEDLKIDREVVVFDIDFEKLSEHASEEHEYRPISKFPAAVRDIAVLIPKSVKVVEVLNKINNIGGSLIRDIDLFDIYEGEELPLGRKNLAFHLIYQGKSRTLTAKEIDGVQNKIIKTLEKNPEWEVRR